MNAEPLILTLKLDDRSFDRMDRLRRTHFPPERNLIPAHLTLFHHLPGEELDSIVADLAEEARAQPPVALRAARVRFLGRGVAYAFEAPELAALRGRLAARWSGWMTAQDRQGFRPHVTVQNKVTAEKARALAGLLEASFAPFEMRGEGVLLWRHLGGPWDAVAEFVFSPDGR